MTMDVNRLREVLKRAEHRANGGHNPGGLTAILSDIREAIGLVGEPVAASHFGDPCVHCGTPHDEVKPGPCAGGFAEPAARELLEVVTDIRDAGEWRDLFREFRDRLEDASAKARGEL